MTAPSKPTPTTDLQLLAVGAKQLAELLSLSVRTIRTMDTAGKLPKPVRLNGRAVRWVVSEVEAWLRAGAPDRTTWAAIKDNGRGTGR